MPSFSRLSLTKQISSASILVILLTMFVLTAFVSVTGTRTAIQTGHAELNQQARSVQQMLDGYFKAVNLRAERQLNMLEQWMPGILTATSNMVDTNGMLLPELKVGDLPVNADHQLLDEFKNLTGTDIAFLAVHQGRVYRASTLLQKDGKSMDGSEISVDDPVTKHLLEGKDFSGLVFRAGKYYFLKTKVVLNPQGKVVAGLSLRVSLDVELEQMRQLFGDMKVGNTGGVSILRVGGQDNGGGEWMVHTKLQSKKLNEMESNSPWLQTMTQLLQVRPEQADMDVNPNNGVNEQVFVSTVESAPWEWLVIVSAPRAEFLEEAASTRNLIIFSGVLASLVCALVVYFLLRNRLKPLTEAVVVLRRVGDGDLTASVQHVLSHSENEIDMIGEAVNRTSQHMRHLIEGVDQACKELLSASESLKRQADIAIDSASQQLDAVSSMSTGVEEMHVTVSQVAQNASDAANASAEVRQQTNTGRNMVAGTVTDMSSIANQVEQSAEVVESLGKNSQQILNIVEVIRDIADRTNLLALNAAIEAARAGESGRGFAVVADEVRKLAEQTSTSTQEISATVDSILAQTNLAVDKMSGVSRSVGEGAARAKQAGLALDEIDRQIESSVTWANDIAHSTGEQQVVTERFADTVLRIHELAQRNHGASQNSDLAAREMIGLSHRLKEVVQKFKLT